MLVPITDLAKQLGVTYQAVLYQAKIARTAFPANFKIVKSKGKKFLDGEDAARIRKYYRSKLSRHV